MKKEILTIDKERVRECMEECPEFKDIATKLWPEMKKKAPEPEVDITKDIDWEVTDFEGNYWLMGNIDGNDPFYIRDAGAIIFNNPRYEKDYDIIEVGDGFKIVRRAK